MPTGDRKELMRIARSIADGRPVDWDLLAMTHPELRSRMEKMRRIQSLAETSRSLAADAGSEAVTVVAKAPDRWGPLEIVEKVGEGGFGEVFRAYDPILQREVALKLARTDSFRSPSDPEANLGEARRLARVRHPNVLAIHGVEVHDGRAGMWTDFIRGRTLEEIVRQGPPAAVPFLAVAGSDLCRALEAVHAAGIIHGDVKAANAMREDDGRVILMDFGAGISAADDPADAPAVGTPLVMAPELLAGGSPSAASDIYALGVLLYRLASGRYPIEASTHAELGERHREGARLPLAELRPDLPEPFIRAIERALHPDPGRRYGSAREMESVLRASLGEAPDDGDRGDLADRLHNVPAAPLRFVGRARELREARRLTIEGRLLTLVGPGGVGKTRIAMEIAAESAAMFRDGVYWVDLVTVTDAERLEPELARVLGVREDPSRSLASLVAEHLRPLSVLIVLDNCEHLRAACSELIDRILTDAPAVRLMATSREPLGCGGERTLAVSAMGVPPESRSTGEEPGPNIAEHDSVRLFIDRAVRSRPEFRLTRANAGSIARICRRLDGIPLAIELAASRVKVLAVDEIARRLDESFKLLTSSGERVPHHATLHASIEWSYRLLEEDAKSLLRRLSVFEGAWTLAAAEAVCADEGAAGGTIAGASVLDLLEELVDRSLVGFHVFGTEEKNTERAAYSMLQMVREFALDRARESGEEEALCARHIRYFVRLADQAHAELYGPNQEEWLRLIASQLGNVRAAIRRSMEPGGNPDDGAQIAYVARRYWLVRGSISEGRQIHKKLLEHPDLSAVQRARALISAASLAWGQGDLKEVVRLGKEAVEVLRPLNNPDGMGAALSLLGAAASDQGRYDEARSMMEQALEVRRALGQKTQTAVLLGNLGVVCARQGDLDAAGRHYEEARDLYAEIGDRPSLAVMLSNLSATAYDRGDRARARSLILESISIQRQSESRYRLGAALSSYARILIDDGELEEARGVLVEAMTLQKEGEDRPGIAGTLERFGALLIHQGRPVEAARILGAVDAMRSSMGQIRHQGLRAEREATEARIIGAIGEGRFARHLAEGRALSLERAMEEATA